MAKEKVVNLENQDASEDIQVTNKPKVGQRIKTTAENFKLDVELFWQRNKKKLLVGAGVIAGATVGVLGLKKFAECDDCLIDENGEMVSEADEPEITEDETESSPVDSETEEI